MLARNNHSLFHLTADETINYCIQKCSPLLFAHINICV